jgi:hypothetical protein
MISENTEIEIKKKECQKAGPKLPTKISREIYDRNK